MTISNLTGIERDILTAMEAVEPGYGMVREIAAMIGNSDEYTCRCLKRLVDYGHIEQTARGVYRLRTAKGTLNQRVDSIRATLRGCG